MQHRQHFDTPGPVRHEGLKNHASGYAHSNVVSVQQRQSAATNDVHAYSVGCPLQQPLPSQLLPVTSPILIAKLWATCGVARAIGASPLFAFRADVRHEPARGRGSAVGRVRDSATGSSSTRVPPGAGKSSLSRGPRTPLASSTALRDLAIPTPTDHSLSPNATITSRSCSVGRARGSVVRRLMLE